MRLSSLLPFAVAAIVLILAFTINAPGITGVRIAADSTPTAQIAADSIPTAQIAEFSSPAKVIVLGDSFSIGCCAPIEKTWPSMFAARLEADLANVARGGETSESLIHTPYTWPSGRTQSQFNEALSLLAESDNIVAVTLAIGINDLFAPRDPNTGESCFVSETSACRELIEAAFLTYQANLHFVVGELRSATDPGTPLLMMSNYFGSPDWRLNRIIQSEINHHEAIPVPASKCFRETSEQLLVSDGIHTSEAGHRVIADLHTNAFPPDTDGDGLSDLMEGVLNTNPFLQDSNRDECLNAAEFGAD